MTSHVDIGIDLGQGDETYLFGSVEQAAEGVETIEQFALVKEIGCDLVQGYYLSRPLPAADMLKRLSASPWAPRKHGRTSAA